MPYSQEFKYDVLIAYENGNYTVNEVCEMFRISKYSFRKWVEQFQKYGAKGLKPSYSWKRYSKGLKEKAVYDYLSGKHSQYEIVAKYEISSRSVPSFTVIEVFQYTSHGFKRRVDNV
jgi:transposase